MLSFYVYQFVPIVIVEALVLWRMKWGGLRASAFDALMANFASFLGLLLGLGPYITSFGPWGLTLFCTYSIMVEGSIFMLLERHDARKIWLTALIANVVSGLMLGLETILHLFKVPGFIDMT